MLTAKTQGNAKIAGMATELSLDDGRYAWVLSVFFFGYLVCEVPSNMILSRSKPSIFLPATMLIWGALSALMPTSKSYGALLGFRFVLGCVEAGFFPGVLYYLTCWYTKAELGRQATRLPESSSSLVTRHCHKRASNLSRPLAIRSRRSR